MEHTPDFSTWTTYSLINFVDICEEADLSGGNRFDLYTAARAEIRRRDRAEAQRGALAAAS